MMHINTLNKKNLEERIFYALQIKKDLENQINNELSRSDLVSEGAREFSAFLKSLLQIIDTHLNWFYRKQIKDFSDNENKKNNQISISDIESQIYEVSLLIKRITPMSKFVTGARAPTNHWSLVSLIERFSRCLYPEARAIIRPRWEYNYSYISLKDEIIKIMSSTNFSDENIASAINVQISKSPHFFSLAYPPTSNYNIMMSAIWAHELAHLADNIEAFYEARNLASESEDRSIAPPDQIEFLSTKLLRSFSSKPSEELYNALFSSLIKEEITTSEEERRKIFGQVYEHIAALVHVWARELFADIFSIHMFGPAALFAYLEFVGSDSKRLDISSNYYYPTERIRLRFMLQEYNKWSSNSAWVNKFPVELKMSLEMELSYLEDLLGTKIDNIILPRTEDSFEWADQKVMNIAYQVLYNNLDIFMEKIYELVEKIKARNDAAFIKPEDLENTTSQVSQLMSHLPPVFNVNKENENKLLGLVVNAGWLVWLHHKYYGLDNTFPGYAEKSKIFEGINLLLQKSIENAEIKRWFDKRRIFGKTEDYFDDQSISADDFSFIGAVLPKLELTNKINNNLKVIPLLDSKSQIGSCSIDVRLGNQFIVTQTPLVSSLDTIEFEKMEYSGEYQNKISVPLGKPFVLHPGQFVLGSTLEFLSIPNDIMGLLIGRSSWGRLGFVISTPNKVAPGFKGCLTLQLSNLGNVPILLYPASRIGQIIFFSIRQGGY